MSQSTTGQLRNILQRDLGGPIDVDGVVQDYYVNITFLDGGRTRHLFVADQMVDERFVQKVVLKVDRDPSQIEKRGARGNAQRGYGTSTEADIISNLYGHGVLDISTKEKGGRPHPNILGSLCRSLNDGTTVVIEPYIKSAKTLEERVANKRCSIYEAELIFGQLLSAYFQLENKGVVHRDLHPSNILVKRNFEVYIIDFATAARVNTIDPSYRPTAGGRSVTDPTLFAAFRPAQLRSNRLLDVGATMNSEIYSLGSIFFYMLQGQAPFCYDPDEPLGRSADAENMLKEDGELDQDKHKAALERLVKNLPSSARSYNKLLKLCLSTRASYRRYSISELVRAFLDGRIKRIDGLINNENTIEKEVPGKRMVEVMRTLYGILYTVGAPIYEFDSCLTSSERDLLEKIEPPE